MTHIAPQSSPQNDDPFDDLQRDLASVLAAAVPSPVRAGPPRPVAATAGAGRPMWGPSHPNALSPIQLLAKVAYNAHKLKHQVDGLLQAVTGEEPQHRSTAVQNLPASLLPAISMLADEIERVHAGIGQAVEHLRGRL